jgi:hypothetical protein
MYTTMRTFAAVSPKTTFLLHEITYLHEESLAPHKRHDMMTNTAIQKLNGIAQALFQQFPSQQIIHVPTYNLSRYGDVEPMGDGLHYKVS